MRRLLLSLPILLSLGCEPEPAPPMPGDVTLTRAWQSETFAGCVLASPLEHDGHVIVSTGDGRVVALDPDDGTIVWELVLPEPEGTLAHVIATPVIVGDRLVLTWQVVDATARDPAAGPRSAHHVAVVDLVRGELDPAFPIVTLAASRPSADGSGEVVFRASNALSRSRLVHATTADHELGLVYVSFGNARDIQPWHGWIFELDLDAWRARGAESAIASVLLTSPSNECGIDGESGSDDMICGAGVWSPAGPLLVPDDEHGFALIVPTGNGALDLATRSYAHTLMRVRGPGLSFDPRCDASACAEFDVLDPAPACIASCEDLFVPRLSPEDPPFDAPGCEELTFFECYAALDWDLGANTPARVELASGRVVYVLPAKDGGVYLLDDEHLGTLHDRVQVVAACGAGGVPCEANWAGTMVTQPLIADVDGTPLAIIATFMPDAVHPAGLVALRVIEDEGGAHLEPAWTWPSFDGQEARERFRRHPSGLRLVTIEGEDHVAIVEQGRLGSEPGVLHLVRARDGAHAERVALDGPGQRYAVPLALGTRLIVPSCDQGNAGPGHVEAWDAVVVR
ncbi:PQQ-binding-like beta-propeller repeat protein [Sandaracinus amylolyticus]|uniref:Pyrrolo-quinoline quinone repeat domain-containing protein n=1 Tax=Sandaracinus amylolyticus TaxID=927083 RepID=A0A0F6VYS4_9BACT|nr:PQQ-binding-like beta-propeller repeat protein [Sandaracinus amylolyticus]AKF03048.1 hypothetical protein DB32_000197 [Sandaracinus amylolyticus]